MTNIISDLAIYLALCTNMAMSCGTNSIAYSDLTLASGSRVSYPVETVCVVTNVTQWNNEERSPHRFSWSIGELEPGSVTKIMTEKTETTDIIEVKTLRFAWNGEEIVVKRERVLSHNVKRWKLKQDWIEEPAKEQP